MLNQTLELLPLEDQPSNLIWAAEQVNEKATAMSLHPGTQTHTVPLMFFFYFIKIMQQVGRKPLVWHQYSPKGTVYAEHDEH